MYIKVHMYRVSYKWLSPGSEITVKKFFFFTVHFFYNAYIILVLIKLKELNKSFIAMQ